jgi:hypothetical protein
MLVAIAACVLGQVIIGAIVPGSKAARGTRRSARNAGTKGKFDVKGAASAVRVSGAPVTILIGQKAPVRSLELPSKRVTLLLDETDAVVGIEVRSHAVLESPGQKIDERELFLSLENAACSTEIDVSHLRKKARSGELTAVKISEQWFTTIGWLDKYLKDRKPRGRPRRSQVR